MSERPLRIGIEVSGADFWALAGSLREHLLPVDGLDVGPVEIIGGPVMASRLTVGLSSAAKAHALARVLTQWLSRGSNAVAVRITCDDLAPELCGGTAVQDLSQQLEPLLSHLTQTVDSADEPARVEEPAPRHRRPYQDLDRSLPEPPPLSAPPTTAVDRAEQIVVRPYAVSRGWTDCLSGSRGDRVPASTLPVTIYLSKDGVHDQVEAAIDTLLAAAGLRIADREEPIIGSWFRRMRAVVKSPAAREGALVAAHAADSRLVLGQDAVITATLLQNLGPVIASLQPTKDAVLRVGALLIVKVDWVVNVFQLTAAQQVLLDHQPQLAVSPHEIIAALGLAASGSDDESRVPGIDGRL